ncbi:hypothetical protein CH373_16650 [Leptospira perolatii]|uniref:Uncharacterized protein n=1 Tax=Leptospira perolatii TaxID=2023191 RepID=A0A2M9ZIX3_9LEPT|nr:hypothetical protein [Leptospira perolatii]PJZ68625.1 hypothetical protein CH360_15195 [Leptospira perolatii]PJZ71972.1 hypothetical protein CH373_16650 [Leptospira perolatii]
MSALNHLDLASIIFLCISIVYAVHGFLHQLIVGGAIAVFQHPDERQSRLLLMVWIATGGFMSFMGLLPAVLLILYGIEPAPVKAVLWTNLLSLTFLCIHSILCGLRQLPKPVRVGFYLTVIFTFAHIVFLFYHRNS